MVFGFVGNWAGFVDIAPFVSGKARRNERTQHWAARAGRYKDKDKEQKMCAAQAAAASEPDAPRAAGGKMFEVKKWNSVALWSWDIEVDVCAICRNNIMDPCIECQTNPKDNPEECTVAWGVCNVC